MLKLCRCIVSKGGSISQTLLKANVTILNNTACKLQYSTLTNNMICAAAPGKDTCQVRVTQISCFAFRTTNINDFHLFFSNRETVVVQ